MYDAKSYEKLLLRTNHQMLSTLIEIKVILVMQIARDPFHSVIK